MSSRTRTNPTGPSSDPVSEAAPGVRTEAEVIADEQAAAEAAAAAAPPGATGNPLVHADIPDEPDEDTLVHYLRESDGTVQSVNPGTPEHAVLESSGDWKKTTRAKAKAAPTRSFVHAPKAGS